jgi:F-type H+-transporting ATPase subunit gamma
MPSLKSLKVRIASVKSTQKITKAMKMVSASKLKRAQEAAEAARPYSSRMEGVIASLAAKAGGDGASPLLIGTGRDQVHLVVVATGERGLCGAFNTNIVKSARLRIDGLVNAGKTVKVLCVGKKGRVQLQRTHARHIIDTIDLSAVKKLGFADADAIARRVLAMFDKGEFDVAWLFYAQFKSALTQIPTEQKLIPVQLATNDNAPKVEAAVEYEPGEEEILADLLPRNIAVQLYKALLENMASFYGAQMNAMDSATRNAGDMIKRLSISYNRQRQAAITKELIEIISGAEAL